MTDDLSKTFPFGLTGVPPLAAQLLKRACHIGGIWSFKRHCGALRGMAQGEGEGVEGDPPERYGFVRCGRAIERIGDDWQLEGGQVDADLMTATAFWHRSYQCVAGKSLQHTEASARRLAALMVNYCAVTAVAVGTQR